MNLILRVFAACSGQGEGIKKEKKYIYIHVREEAEEEEGEGDIGEGRKRRLGRRGFLPDTSALFQMKMRVPSTADLPLGRAGDSRSRPGEIRFAVRANSLFPKCVLKQNLKNR